MKLENVSPIQLKRVGGLRPATRFELKSDISNRLHTRVLLAWYNCGCLTLFRKLTHPAPHRRIAFPTHLSLHAWAGFIFNNKPLILGVITPSYPAPQGYPPCFKSELNKDCHIEIPTTQMQTQTRFLDDTLNRKHTTHVSEQVRKLCDDCDRCP